MNIELDEIKKIIEEELRDTIDKYKKEVTDTMKKASQGDKQAAKELYNNAEKIPGFKFNVIDGTKMTKDAITKKYKITSGEETDTAQKTKKVAKITNDTFKQNSQELQQNQFPSDQSVITKRKELLSVFNSVYQMQQNCFNVLGTLGRAGKIAPELSATFLKTLQKYNNIYNDYMDKGNNFFDQKIKPIKDEKQKKEISINLLNKQIDSSKKMLGYYERILDQIDKYDED